VVKLHPKLKEWLKWKREDMQMGRWIVRQSKKGSGKGYSVGKIIDFVYDYDHPEYLHIILKIKANPHPRKGWGCKGWVTKAFYMTTSANNKKVINGQRPIVCGTSCFKRLIHKARKKRFF